MKTLLNGILVLSLVGGLTGCSSKYNPSSAAWVRIDLEKSSQERLLRYYFGGYVRAEGADPFDAGLVRQEGSTFYLNPARLPKTLSARPVDADGNEVLGWKEVEAFLQATWYEARAVPPTLADLHALAPYPQPGAPWLMVEVDGAMTFARRRLYVAESALREALQDYRRNGERLLYPVGTTIVGEHHHDGQHIETTAMRKRADGFWDFFVYNQAGHLVDTMAARPKALRVPTQCVGCHFGTRLFEPERSFPAPPTTPGPDGPRALRVDPALRNEALTAFFNEHRKRSDTILGLYNTLFVARLLEARRQGTLPASDAALLDSLGF
jgi:hypothetical protein